MSNFSIFDKAHLNLLLEPFAPGMAEHITPIKYEALTPDSFLLLFRTTAKGGEYHYFISLETDFQDSFDGARCTIEDWHDNEVIKFWPINEKYSKEITEDINDYKVSTSGPYFAFLAEVKRPTHKGYWAESMLIMPGDNIEEKIKKYPKKTQTNIRKALANVLQNSIDPKASFIDTLNSKKLDIMKNDINTLIRQFHYLYSQTGV